MPPLEGFWWQEGVKDINYADKSAFNWISIIRLPDFVTQKDFDWAVETAEKKKKQYFSKVQLLTYDEGLCVQCMHVGAYEDEPATIKAMEDFAKQRGYTVDITDKRFHHEIYLSDPRKGSAEKQRTVLRHPVK